VVYYGALSQHKDGKLVFVSMALTFCIPH